MPQNNRMSERERRHLAYPNFNLPCHGLPAEIRIKIWKLLLHKTVIVFGQIRYNKRPTRTYGPNDFVGFSNPGQHYLLLDCKDTFVLATRLLQLNRELHHEVKSVLRHSIILDLRYLIPNYIYALTIAPPIRDRLKGFTIIHDQPQVRSSRPTQAEYPPDHVEQMSALIDLIERVTSDPTQPLQYLEISTRLDELPAPVLVMVCDHVGHKLEHEFSRKDMLAVLQRFEPELKDYCALLWIPGLWKSLLILLSEGRIREVALCCGSTQGFFGDLVRAHGVEHVFGVSLGDYGLEDRLRVQVEYDEDDAVDKFGRQKWNKETIVRLRV